MSDTKLNDFLAAGTAAARGGFTPSPPTPASGPDPGYFWFETDTGDTYSWKQSTTSWVKIASSTATGTVTNTGTLTAHAVILGNGTVDVKALGSLGTTSTVLHGNAAGDPSFGAIVTADITAANVTLAKIQNAAANSRWLGSGSAGSGASYTENTFGAGLTPGASSVALSTAALTRAITFGVYGGGSALTTSFAGEVYVPYACTITAVTLVADQSGSVQLDIQKVARGSYPASLASIVASDPPVLSSAATSTDSALTSWTTAISAGDVLRFLISSVSTITRLNCVLTVTVS